MENIYIDYRGIGIYIPILGIFILNWNNKMKNKYNVENQSRNNIYINDT